MVDLKVSIPIDEILAASNAGKPQPADERQWIVIEVRGDTQMLTVHNLTAQQAAGLLSWAHHHELHEIESTVHEHGA